MLMEGQVHVCVCVSVSLGTLLWECVCIRWAWTGSFDSDSMRFGRVLTWAAGGICLMMKNWSVPSKWSSTLQHAHTHTHPIILRWHGQTFFYSKQFYFKWICFMLWTAFLFSNRNNFHWKVCQKIHALIWMPQNHVKSFYS